VNEITRIWGRLFLGSLRNAEALAGSNPHGVTTVITLCSEKLGKKNPGINYLRFPIDDSRPLPVGQFDSIIDAIAENIRWGTLLLHCAAGTSRSPIIAAAWMHVVGYKNIEAALMDIANLRPIISASRVLLKRIKELL
jgi:atypical dual specificity phosphatase